MITRILLGAALAFWPVAASAAVPPAPLGLNSSGSEYALVANDLWKVSLNGSGFVPAKEVVLIRGAIPGATGAVDRQDLAYIWASTCTASQQILIFRRTIFMPGPAKTFAAEFFDNTGSSASNLAVASVSVRINDKPAFSFTGGTKNIPPTVATIPKLFKFGVNTIDVRVVKRAQSGTSFGRCRYGTPPRPLGVYFNMHGEFESDLWLWSDRNTTTEVFVRLEGNAVLPLQFTVSPRNLGLSGVQSGKLTTNIQVSNFQEFGIASSTIEVDGDGLYNCKIVERSNFSAKVECDVYRMPPNSQAKLTFFTLLKSHPTYTTAWVFASTDIYSPTRDPRPQTNGWRRIRNFCGPAATDPRCPPPP